ncbi:MAG: hypothetical protein H6585_02575 [Flavobacteriales bacterium]|nr:hypothetical protein [Flavobacteriales bacterium]MCB9447213.1 hypothetical protein [Flavobacteriales bacterium]
MSTRSLLCVVMMVLTLPATAQRNWTFELHGGVVGNMRLPLVIRQAGYPVIRIPKAHFVSEPLVDPFYWDWRFSRWFNNQGIEFEAIHHKLYLVNKPPEVQRFGISHGYNMVMVNYLKKWKGFYYRIGAGKILLHPENTIRNRAFPEGPGFDIRGYYLRGWVINGGLARKVPITPWLYGSFEAKVTASAADVPIVEGLARIYNVAFQGIFGVGVYFGKKSE